MQKNVIYKISEKADFYIAKKGILLYNIVAIKKNWRAYYGQKNYPM